MATETIRDALTPEDVESKTFTPVRLREGYDMAEVDHFLDEVVATLRKAAADSEAQRREAIRNSPGLNGTPASDGATPGATAHQLSASEATSAAVRVLQMAEDEAAALRSGAAHDAEQAVTEAQRRAAEIVEQASSQAASLTAESEHRATELDAQTQARRSELLTAIEAERARLAEEVDGLRAFEREYRSRLRGWFQEQITRLEAERSPAPAAGDSLTTDTPHAGS